MGWSFIQRKPDGSLDFDLGVRIMRGIQSFATGGVSGSATVIGDAGGDRLVVSFNGGPNRFAPDVSLSGNMLTWTYPYAERFSMPGTIYIVAY